jgi:hypothetical protein
MLLIGKPSISMGHLYHGYVSHNQRVNSPYIPLNHHKSPLKPIKSQLKPPLKSMEKTPLESPLKSMKNHH